MSLSSMEYGDLMSKCIVANGVIEFPGVTPNKLYDVYIRFSKDLYGMKIPHYRVIGFWHSYDDKHAQSLFRTNDVYDQSCIELSMKMKYVVPMRNGGNDGTRGCFYGVNEDMSAFSGYEDFNGFNRDNGLDNGRSIDTRTSNILRKDRSEIGSLMVDTSKDGITQMDYFTTSDLWYTQRMIDDIKLPMMLIPNKFLSYIKETELAEARTFIFIMKGTGRMGFMETQELFSERCSNIMPCSTKWDLSEFFVPRIPDAGDVSLRLTCFEQLDWFVLQDILHSYGRMLTDEC